MGEAGRGVTGATGVPQESASEQTVQLDHLVDAVRRLEAADRERMEVERKRIERERRAARSNKHQSRAPMEWSAALVLIVFALVALGAWVAWLFVA